MRIVLLPSLVLAISLVPATARAVTPQEIVKLTKAGVSDDVIIALIDHDRTVFDLTSDQLIALKRDGVSEAVVLAMLRSAPLEPTTPTGAPAVPTAAEAGAPVGEAGAAVTYSAPPASYPIPGPAGVPPGFPYVVPYVAPYPGVVGAARVWRVRQDQVRMRAFSPPTFVAPLPVANTLGPVSARGMFFTNPGGAAGMWFQPAVPDTARARPPR